MRGAPTVSNDAVVTGALSRNLWGLLGLFTTGRPVDDVTVVQTSPSISYVLAAPIVDALSIHGSGAAGTVATLTTSLLSRSVTQTVA